MPGVRESRAPFRQGFRGECEIEEYDMQTLTQLPGIQGESQSRQVVHDFSSLRYQPAETLAHDTNGSQTFMVGRGATLAKVQRCPTTTSVCTPESRVRVGRGRATAT